MSGLFGRKKALTSLRPLDKVAGIVADNPLLEVKNDTLVTGRGTKRALGIAAAVSIAYGIINAHKGAEQLYKRSEVDGNMLLDRSKRL